MKTIRANEIIKSAVIGCSEHRYVLKVGSHFYTQNGEPPNLFHQIMQRIFFGFEWFHREEQSMSLTIEDIPLFYPKKGSKITIWTLAETKEYLKKLTVNERKEELLRLNELGIRNELDGLDAEEDTDTALELNNNETMLIYGALGSYIHTEKGYGNSVTSDFLRLHLKIGEYLND